MENKKCNCNYGYTGEICNVKLLDDRSSIETLLNSAQIEKDTNVKDSENDSESINKADNGNKNETNNKKIPKSINTESENNTSDGEGSASGEIDCPSGQFRVNMSEDCVDVLTFFLQAQINTSAVVDSLQKDVSYNYDMSQNLYSIFLE